MALMKMPCAVGSGGDGSVHDTFTIPALSAAYDEHITVGFEPSKLVMYFIPSASYNTGVTVVYDSSIDTSNCWRGFNYNNGGSVQFKKESATNGANPLVNVDSTGFNIHIDYPSASWMSGTWEYFAIR